MCGTSKFVSMFNMLLKQVSMFKVLVVELQDLKCKLLPISWFFMQFSLSPCMWSLIPKIILYMYIIKCNAYQKSHQSKCHSKNIFFSRCCCSFFFFETRNINLNVVVHHIKYVIGDYHICYRWLIIVCNRNWNYTIM